MTRALALALLAIALGTPAVAAEDLIGAPRTYVTADEDTLLDVARRFDLGYVELKAANPGVDPWLPGAGTPITLPTAHLLPDAPRRGIVINLAEQRLYYFPKGGGPVVSYPLGIGRQGWETPLGATRVVRKRVKPTWHPPASIRALNPDLPRAAPPGPANPLGDFALDLGWPAYLIHGTNNPWGVGRRVSSGCIRLYPEDIAALFPRVAVGTPVRVVDQPVVLGWSRGRLYLAVHPSIRQADEIEREGAFKTRESLPDLVARVLDAAGNAEARLDWAAIARAAREHWGIPVAITPAPACGNDAATCATTS